ncbi:hypothetical protein ACFC4M_27590, partial [Streptomyces sp. NPDC056019]
MYAESDTGVGFSVMQGGAAGRGGGVPGGVSSAARPRSGCLGLRGSFGACFPVPSGVPGLAGAGRFDGSGGAGPTVVEPDG